MIKISLYNTYGIYGIINKINNKIYVGKTEMNFGDRRDCHFASLHGGYHINPHLQRAFDKYGEENFSFVVLYECNNENTDEVNSLEMKYIKEYMDKGLAYNIGIGGDGGANLGKYLSEETKRKIGNKNRINMTGKKLTDDTKNKMSASQKKRFEKMTEEEKEEYSRRISEYASGYKWSEESKGRFSKIQQTNPNGAKYTIEDVKEIRRLHEKENLGYTEISNLLNIPRHTVYLIATYRRWKHIA